MSDAYFFTVSTMIFGGSAAFVFLVYWLGMRQQRRFFAEHPEYPNPFEAGRSSHTPAE